MTFVQSPISFGAYVFPAGFRLAGRDNDAVIEEIKVPFLDGTSAPAGSRNSKVIRVTGQIGGNGAVDSSGSYITNRDQAEAEINLMTSYLEAGYQQLKVGSTDGRFIWAQKRKFSTVVAEATNQTVIQVDVEFLAQDPRWLAAAASTLSGASLAAVLATNSGSALTYPKFTFTGAYVNPFASVNPGNGAGYITAATVLTMGAGDTLVIDCDPRNRANAVLLNGVPRLDLLGSNGITNTMGDSAFFPYLLPGNNAVTAHGSSGGTSVTASWQNAWLY